MKYWPITNVLRSPLLTDTQKREVVYMNNQRVPLSDPTMQACKLAAQQIVPNTSLAYMFTEGAHVARVFVRYPNEWEWNTLERGGFTDSAQEGFGYGIDRLH